METIVAPETTFGDYPSWEGFLQETTDHLPMTGV